MNKSGSILMITLWILTILVIFTVGLGHRASINLRLARYQRDRLRATYLAKAGINRAIVELEKDRSGNTYDSLKETWSTGIDPQTHKSLFENVEIKEGSSGTFIVRYLYDRDTYLYMADEERKININRTDELGKRQLIELFILNNIREDEAKELTNTIIDWIDRDTNTVKDSTIAEDNIFKNRELVMPEELLLILEYFYQKRGEEKFQEKARIVYSDIKDLITVYGEKDVNINTAPREVLEILFKAGVREMRDRNEEDIPTEQDIQNLLDAIDNYRKGTDESNAGYFIISDMNLEAIKTKLRLGGIVNNQTKIIDRLIGSFTAISENFRIESKSDISNITKNITAIYNRNDEKFVYWHEN